MKLLLLPTVLATCALVAQDAETLPPTENHCVTCHRDPATLRAQQAFMGHLFEHWYGSVHGRSQVGCDQCHGGDPSAAEKDAAHLGVAPAAVESSRIYYRNLPETCGACHQEVVREFRQSDHFINLKADRLGPTCTTCHGFDMEIAGVQPARIAERCTVCHNNRMNVHPEVRSQLDEVVAAIAAAKATVQLASVTLRLAQEERLPTGKLAEDLATVQARLRDTGRLWHRFELHAFRTDLEQIKVAAESVRRLAREALLAR